MRESNENDLDLYFLEEEGGKKPELTGGKRRIFKKKRKNFP